MSKGQMVSGFSVTVSLCGSSPPARSIHFTALRMWRPSCGRGLRDDGAAPGDTLLW